MAVKAYLIYDAMADRDLKDALVAQSQQAGSTVEITDSSPITPAFTWQAHARTAISMADVVVFLAGKGTDHPFGNYNTELELAQSLGKPYVLLAGYGADSKKPTKAKDSDQLVDGGWESVAAAFGEIKA